MARLRQDGAIMERRVATGSIEKLSGGSAYGPILSTVGMDKEQKREGLMTVQTWTLDVYIVCICCRNITTACFLYVEQPGARSMTS